MTSNNPVPDFRSKLQDILTKLGSYYDTYGHEKGYELDVPDALDVIISLIGEGVPKKQPLVPTPESSFFFGKDNADYLDNDSLNKQIGYNICIDDLKTNLGIKGE